jgi:hypothetical protein
MATLDPRVDAYIAQAAPFAQPILTHLRALVHAACPEAEETMKWSTPHFLYKGMLCHMAAFKAHCAFGFWKGSVLFPEQDKGSMGHLGKIASLDDLPPKKVLTGYLRQAMKLNDDGAAPAPRAKAAPRPLEVPAYFAAALAACAPAHKVFEAGSTSFKREYVDWLQDAKTETTRQRRMAQAIEWLAEGKARNWKYESC